MSNSDFWKFEQLNKETSFLNFRIIKQSQQIFGLGQRSKIFENRFWWKGKFGQSTVSSASNDYDVNEIFRDQNDTESSALRLVFAAPY